MKNYILLFLAFTFVSTLTLQAFAAQTRDAERTLDAYAPFEELIQVSGSDDLSYDPYLRGCIIETAGDLYVQTAKGDATVTITVAANQLVPALITKVMASTDSTQVCGR